MAEGFPKYREIIDWVRKEVYSGKLSYGEQLATESEISARFGVSRQTVRRALSDLIHSGLIESRRGSGSYVVYRPEFCRKKSRVVGVITTYVDTYIFPSIIRGIENELSAAGYSLQLALTQNRTDSECKALRSMMENGVDGMILEPAKSALPTPNRELYGRIRDMHIPLLFINAYCPGLDIPHVSLDDRAAGRAATEALLRSGHTEIGGIFKMDDYQGHLRYEGYLQAMHAAGRDIHDDRVMWYTTENAQPAVAQALQRLTGCTGVVCYNDEMAIRMAALLKDAGRSVPQDMSLTSVDDSELARLGPVALTSVIHPKRELGLTAARQLLRMIAGEKSDVTVEFPAHVRHRGSVQVRTQAAV